MLNMKLSFKCWLSEEKHFAETEGDKIKVQ